MECYAAVKRRELLLFAGAWMELESIVLVGVLRSQGPAETAAAEGKRAPAEKHLEVDTAARCCAGSGGIESPMLPPHCSLQDLPVEMLVEIFTLLPATDLPSLAQNLDMTGMSYREFYAKIFPYRNILGLWQLDNSHGTLLNVVVDGLCITGWTYTPSDKTHVQGPVESKPSFRIRLTETKSAAVECMEGRHSRPHSRHMQIRKDRFSTQCNKTDHLKDSPTRLREEWGQVLVRKDRLRYDCLTYRRLYLPPNHPDDLIRPGLFQGKYHRFGLMIAMLSFHGEYARVTEITGNYNETIEIHLMRRIQLGDGKIFRNFNKLYRVVLEIEDQVIREKQQENGTEESEGHGWQSPAQPGVGESGAAASEEQPVPFVLPVGMRSRLHNYPSTCRMCFYGVYSVTNRSITYPRRFPGVFILFDENHLGFIGLEMKYFILFGRVQNTFQNVEAPSPKAFLEMLSNIQSGPSGRSSWRAL
ncbi:LOW QUALITY PROTEIN: F-box only protein 31-like [Myotis myotis]|uniref:LOW QUALITY PROTEIN: F-box only protein 31-like n=1 Tax=Myotis myotis TaxID=51298 RepID=UPI00174E8F6F|nr:LOW QUALITY PROTEIN: F-box only protein 31-like [Myotis myotis]